jgi:hypothetical protein
MVNIKPINAQKNSLMGDIFCGGKLLFFTDLMRQARGHSIKQLLTINYELSTVNCQW